MKGRREGGMEGGRAWSEGRRGGGQGAGRGRHEVGEAGRGRAWLGGGSE